MVFWNIIHCAQRENLVQEFVLSEAKLMGKGKISPVEARRIQDQHELELEILQKNLELKAGSLAKQRRRIDQQLLLEKYILPNDRLRVAAT